MFPSTVCKTCVFLTLRTTTWFNQFCYCKDFIAKQIGISSFFWSFLSLLSF